MTPAPVNDMTALADELAAQPLDIAHDKWPTIVPIRLSETKRDLIVAALRAAAPASGEVVAWLMVYTDGSSDVTNIQERMEYAQKNLPSVEITALVAAPTAPVREGWESHAARWHEEKSLVLRSTLKATTGEVTNIMDDIRFHDSSANDLRALARPSQPAPDSPSPVSEETISNAFIEGATLVHKEWVEAHERGDGPPKGDPEFSEYANDYARAILALIETRR